VKYKFSTKSEKTKKVAPTLKCTWDQRFVFKYSKIVEEFFTIGNFKVTVFGGKTEEEIGAFDIDLGGIYNYNGHELFGKWVVLMDYNNLDKGRGFLKVSVSVLAEGDIPKVHKEDELSELLSFTDIQAAALVPPVLKNELEERQKLRNSSLNLSLEATDDTSPIVQRGRGIALLEVPPQVKMAGNSK